MQSKILLLEDDISLSDTIKQFLTHLNYEVIQAFDALQAEELLYESHFDLLLLDVKVPHKNGMDFLLELRNQGNETPAIFITSLHAVSDVTRGFDAGCDDYIRKPFSLKELRVRIDSLLRRQYGSHSEKIIINETFSFDVSNLTLYKNSQAIKLKNKEVQLLKFFLANPNKTLHKSEIYEALWEYHEEPNEGSLRTYIKVLRSYLGKEFIETVKNVGYIYVSK
jgi:DNA-binding response OmpR family regulator